MGKDWINSVWHLVSSVLNGPLGGLIGGAISFWLLEMGVRRRRERHDIAEALAAELWNNSDTIQTQLDEEDPQSIAPYFRTSHAVFDAVANRLGELNYGDIASVTKLYGFLEEYNRIPAVWNERARKALALPENHPIRDAELQELQEAVRSFFETLTTINTDCQGLARHLRTRYALGWRGLIPLRFRPALQPGDLGH